MPKIDCPIKSVTIPRLELLAALIGVRMAKFLRKESKINFNSITIWGDSMCTLLWILGENTDKLPRFITRRLSEIKAESEIKWRYIPTELNPSDCATRGLTLKELNKYVAWWNGPKFLSLKKSNWPKMPEDLKFDNKNIKNEKIFSLNELKIEFIDPLLRNEWAKIVSIAKYVLIFIKNCSKKQINLKNIILEKLQTAKEITEIRKLAEIMLTKCE